MSEERHYTIGELAEAAGVTTRTIRYYTGEGLLPPSDFRGRYSVYTDEHLRRLQLIGKLKETYLPLGEIKERLAGLDAAEVAELLNEQAPASTNLDAVGYIAHILNQHHQVSPKAPAPESQDMARSPAMVREPPASYQAPPAPSPAAAAPPTLSGQPVPARSSGGLLGRILPKRRIASESEQKFEGEQWQRFALSPDAELHIRQTDAPELQEKLKTLLAQAQAIFGQDQDH